MGRISESQETAARALIRAENALATGAWTPSGGTIAHPGGAYPLIAESGDGCRLVDVAGRTYVDWMMGWGPVVFGYRRPEIEEAIVEQLRAGPLLSLVHPIESEVAEALLSVHPWAVRAAFGKNGSDVLEVAVRVARAKTGREGILYFGYHGFHDWYVASMAGARGVPEGTRSLIRPLPFNDLEGCEALFDRYGDRIAAVVLEPANAELPRPGFLEGLRALASRAGALLIYDEIITGFRLAKGGAVEAYGVAPDLACYGKALANGMPLAALIGGGDAMSAVGAVGYGATFRGETLSLAAARACLAIHETEPVPERLASIGVRLRQMFESGARRRGLDAELAGFPARLTLRFRPHGRATPLGLTSLFVQECLERGVLTNGNFLPCTAHDDAAIETTREAFEAALDLVAEALADGSISRRLRMRPLRIFAEDGIVETGDE